MISKYYFVSDNNSPYCVNGLLLDKTKRRDKMSDPYQYDSFFIFGDHESISGSSQDHTDRYIGFGEEKLKKAREASGTKHIRWDAFTPAELDRFVKAYYGESYVATGLVESCNQSNGIPYWTVYFKKVQ